MDKAFQDIFTNFTDGQNSCIDYSANIDKKVYDEFENMRKILGECLCDIDEVAKGLRILGISANQQLNAAADCIADNFQNLYHMYREGYMDKVNHSIKLSEKFIGESLLTLVDNATKEKDAT